MTPYTSLLVLESDADRERFKVKRRFAMRDGEKFFAAGRDNVNYELVQQQMRRAGLWRLGLRRSVLAQLSGLGRDASIFSGVERPGAIRFQGSRSAGSRPTTSLDSIELGETRYTVLAADSAGRWMNNSRCRQ